MTYQVLARKWRPQNFSSLVGQGPIVTALRNALKEGRIAQAYLFSGIRGVGKTTAARVLAKALNCAKGPAADPCNECLPCLEITRGSDLDVIEVDAATYSKVEQVRELTESLRYGPARDRYKVVVLDEVHRLSRQAFDALLKIVEEPPPHLVFIFATTEIEAVPATILSRCQEFHFRRVPSVEVAALLREICTSEHIEASETALRLVARAGEGSVRDAVALLDQLATFGSGTISDEEAIRLLGGLDTALFGRLLFRHRPGRRGRGGRHGAPGRGRGLGPPPRLRPVPRLQPRRPPPLPGGRCGQVDLPAEEAATLAETARDAGYENLLRLVHQLLQSEATVRRSETGALAVEIAWLRAAELPKLRRVEEILSGTASTANAPALQPVPPRHGLPSPPAWRRHPGPPQRPLHPPRHPARARRPRPRPPPRRLHRHSLNLRPPRPYKEGGSRSSLPRRVESSKTAAGRILEEAELRFTEHGLEIVSHPGDHLLRPKLHRSWQIIEQAAAAVWGPGTAVQLIEGSGTGKAAPPELTSVKLELVAENPTVRTVLEIFQGRVERVEEHRKLA